MKMVQCYSVLDTKRTGNDLKGRVGRSTSMLQICDLENSEVVYSSQATLQC